MIVTRDLNAVVNFVKTEVSLAEVEMTDARPDGKLADSWVPSW